MERKSAGRTSDVEGRRRGAGRRRHWMVLAGLCSASLLPLAPAHAAVSQVSGGAYGWKTAVSLFGGPTNIRGTAPSDAVVELPASGQGSTVPMVDAAATGTGQYGPAIIYQGGPAVVSTQGDRGDALHAGGVTSSSTVTDIGYWHGVMLEDTTGVWNPTVGGEMDPFIAAEVTSKCTTAENGTASATTTIVGGRLVDTDSQGNPTNVRQVSTLPAPNTTDQGTLAHIGDNWRVIFNEQIVTNGGKTIEVNAVHLQLLGPTAVGDMYIGHSQCGYV